MTPEVIATYFEIGKS